MKWTRQKTYDTVLIQEVLSEFREHSYNLEDVDILVDLDNTLALWSEKGKEDAAFANYTNEGYYIGLPIFSDAPEVFKHLIDLGANIKILSKYIDNKYCLEEKEIWCYFNLPMIPRKNYIFVPEHEPKSKYIENPRSSILIDDFGDNICEAYEMGIVGVKKTFSGKKREVPTLFHYNELYTLLPWLGIRGVQ